MKELELLIDNVQQMNQPIGKRGRGKQRDGPSPSEVLETLRQVTTDFQKRLNLASKEVTLLEFILHCYCYCIVIVIALLFCIALFAWVILHLGS